MAACRGCKAFGMRAAHAENAAWIRAYQELAELCCSVDYVLAHAMGKSLKKKPFDPPVKCWIEDREKAETIINSSYALSVVARSLIV